MAKVLGIRVKIKVRVIGTSPFSAVYIVIRCLGKK